MPYSFLAFGKSIALEKDVGNAREENDKREKKQYIQ
jgi:hypothetical protein